MNVTDIMAANFAPLYRMNEKQWDLLENGKTPLEVLNLDIKVADRLLVLFQPTVLGKYEDPIRSLICDYAEHVLPVVKDRFRDDNAPYRAICLARKTVHKEEVALYEVENTCHRAALWHEWEAEKAAAAAAWTLKAVHAAQDEDWKTAWDAAYCAARNARESQDIGTELDYCKDIDEGRWQIDRLREVLRNIKRQK